ncbi:5-formyltetrahydrofolate cyclo-ligase [Lactococcus sp.]|uniref:5-formyltetrahydrofolate cyclo-ligase n=1 Tax=Lactococcus sp. TaxID=44273 RepID=UPI0035B2A62C
MESKAETRKNIINFLIKMSENDKRIQTTSILSNLVSSDSWKKARVVGLYLPMPMEFDLTQLFNIAKNEGKRILIPKTLPQRQMIFAEYDKLHLKKSSFGVLEPDGLPEEIPDFILVPGVAWNSKGHRIGFGGGYYDRYLASFKGKTASVYYDLQSVEFESESHDIMVEERFTYTKNQTKT